jgi:carbonic anhydrase/acetyltransferase-like protein (isoleucine patch superfamily)
MATIIGDVVLAGGANVWPGAVLRGDVERITLGEGTSFQDNSVAHADPSYPVVIGADCIVGHMVMIHGAVIGARCLIGIGSTLLNGCEIGEESVVGANALVTQGKKFPPRSLIVGSPARVVRELTDADLAPQREFTARYARRALAYLEQGLGVDLAPYRDGGGHRDAGGGAEPGDESGLVVEEPASAPAEPGSESEPATEAAPSSDARPPGRRARTSRRSPAASTRGKKV